MKVLVSCGLALTLLGTLALEAAAQGSCAGSYNRCKARCPQWSKEPVAKCAADHCAPKLATCRRTGCWTEGPLYGGGTACNLKKSERSHGRAMARHGGSHPMTRTGELS
jgi:hypothetical protein